MADGPEKPETLRSALADCARFVGRVLANGQGGRRDQVAKGAAIAAAAVEKIPSEDEVNAVWDASPFGALERQLRKHSQKSAAKASESEKRSGFGGRRDARRSASSKDEDR